MRTAENRIGILTGGGDVPGLNSVIKSAVYRASELGRQVIGIRKGRSEERRVGKECRL